MHIEIWMHRQKAHQQVFVNEYILAAIHDILLSRLTTCAKCHYVSNSAVSSKAKLLQQIEQLTTVKNELTSEV